MDFSTMGFWEIMYHGRYHFMGGLLFLIFFGVFVWEAVREVRASRAKRVTAAEEIGLNLVHQDALVGQTMADGGEPVEKNGVET